MRESVLILLRQLDKNSTIKIKDRKVHGNVVKKLSQVQPNRSDDTSTL